MMKLSNSREHLFAALNGEPTDRVPVWLLFPYHTTGYYVDVRTHPQYRPVFEASKKYAIILNRRNLSVPLHTPEVNHRQEELTEASCHVKRNHVEYRGESIYTQTYTSDSGRKIKKLLASEADLAFYCSLPVETDTERITAELDRQLPRYLQEKKEFPEELGAMMLDLGEPIGPLYHASNLEEYAIWSLTHDDLIVDLLDRLMERIRIIYRYCLERSLADVYFLVGSELASPPLVSRQTFQRWYMPHAKELIEMIHAYDKKVIQHYHGQIKEILPDFLTMNPDGLHTIEAPPIGDCTLTEAYDITGGDITLIGNMQYDEFRSLSTEQMSDTVRAVLDECQGKRLILSPTAGPFDEDVPDAVIRNYMVFMKTAWTYC